MPSRDHPADLPDSGRTAAEGWGQLFGGNPINANYLARTLRPYGITSRKLRLLGEKRAMGYTADDFRETWDRYLPDLDND